MILTAPAPAIWTRVPQLVQRTLSHDLSSSIPTLKAQAPAAQTATTQSATTGGNAGATTETAPSTPSKLKVGGYVDVYGGPAFPHVGRGATRGYRQFDIRSEDVRLARAQLSLAFADPRSGFGFTLKPFFGDDADILYSFDSGDLPITHYLAEAYATYASRSGKFVLDAGKFYSWIGYEALESPSSDLYSRGLLFTNAQPNYHTGVRASYQIDPKLGVSLYATNGWNQVQRRTSGLSVGAQVRYQATANDALTLGVISGREGSGDRNNAGSYGGIAFANPGALDVTLLDFIATHNFDARTKIAFNGNYAFLDGNTSALEGDRFYGVSVVGRREVGSGIALAGRLEMLADPSGSRLGTSTQLQSASLGLDYAVTPRSTFRIELRSDWANDAIFLARDGGTQRQQNTVNFAVNYRF